MKLALRRDAPACLNCEQEKIEVKTTFLQAFLAFSLTSLYAGYLNLL
jgi:hypothetical protein